MDENRPWMQTNLFENFSSKTPSFEFCNVLLFSFFNWSWLWALQLEIILFLGQSVGDDVIMGSLMTQPSSKLVTWSEMRDNITCLWLEEIRLGLSVQFWLVYQSNAWVSRSPRREVWKWRCSENMTHRNHTAWRNTNDVTSEMMTS